MSTFWIALGLSLLGGLGGLLVASGVLLIQDPLRAKLVPWLVSYAVGALLGISMMGLLPESLDSLPAARVFATLLGGILLFFILEKLVLWRHCHTHDCEVHESSVASVMIGDTFHNFVDGADRGMIQRGDRPRFRQQPASRVLVLGRHQEFNGNGPV